MADKTEPDLADLLKSSREEDRFEGLKRLLAAQPRNLEAILDGLAQRDPSSRMRYGARKALHLWIQKEEAAGRRPKQPAPATAPTEAALREALASPLPEVRARAAEAIRVSGKGALLDLVRPLLAGEADPLTRARMVGLFEQWAAPADLSLLLPLLADPDHRVRAGAVLAVARADLNAAAPRLIAMLQDPDHRVRANCTLGLNPIGAGELLVCLERMLSEPGVAMRDAAAYALSRLVEPRTLPLVRRALADPSPLVRDKAQTALRRLARGGDAEAERVLAALEHPETVPVEPAQVPPALEPASLPEESLEHPNPKVRIRYVTELILDSKRKAAGALVARLARESNDFVVSKLLVGLGELGGPEHAAPVRNYLKHSDTRVVATAIEALTKLAATEVVNLVRPYLAHPNGRIRAAAILYLRRAAPGFDARAALRGMLEARGYELRLAGVWVLGQLGESSDTQLLEPLLSDLSHDVRQAAFRQLERRKQQGDAMAADLLEMCEQGFIERKVQSLRLEPASVNKRLLAFAADVTAIYLVGAALIAAAVFALGKQTDAELMLPVTGAALLVMSVLFFLRDGWRDGRGFGKALMGLRVVDLMHFSGCSKAKSLIRSAFLGVPVLNLGEAVALAFSRDGRRLADRLLETQVIDERGGALRVWHRFALAGVYLGLGLCVLGAGWVWSGKAEGLVAEQVRQATGIDVTGSPWSVAAFLPAQRQLVLEQRTFWHGQESVAIVAWGPLGVREWDEAYWPEAEKGNELMISEWLKREKAQEKGHATDLTTFAGRKASLTTSDFEAGGRTGKLSAASWPRADWIVRVAWSARRPESMSGITAGLSTLLASARFR